MEHTILVAPNYIKELCGVAVIQIGIRYMWAKDEQLNTLFFCKLQKDDDLTQDFLELVKLIASRAAAKK
jgi:hypothetical protein